MKKILIVDDEYFFRQGFRKMIPWEDYGYEVCAEAKNGQEAIDIILENQPDLMFLDINMPLMDGIEVMKYVYESNLKIDIVLLTGYSDFEYARKGIKYGVTDYLLKPVETNDVCQLLKRLSARSDDSTEVVGSTGKLTTGIIQDKLFMDLIYGDISLEKKRLLRQIAGINPASKSYFIVLFEIMKFTDWEADDLSIWKFAVSNIIEELMGNYCGCQLFSLVDTKVCGILWSKDDSDILDIEEIKTKCSEISRIIYNKLGIKIYVGIGNESYGENQMKISYDQAEKALDNRLLNQDSVILYSDIKGYSDNESVFSLQDKRNLLSSIYLYDKDSVCKIVDIVFDRIRESLASMTVVRNVLSEFSSILLEVEQYISSNISPQVRVSNYQEELERCETIKDVSIFIKDILLQATEKFKQSKPVMTISQRNVDKAIEYINHEYHRKDLNAITISENIFLSRNYLCKIFKEYTGLTIGKYIDSIRLEKSKEMFQAGNIAIQDVSDKVGFSDPNYFGKFFKKQTGLTPSQYISTIKLT